METSNPFIIPELPIIGGSVYKNGSTDDIKKIQTFENAEGRKVFYLYSVDNIEYRVPILREVDVTPPSADEVADAMVENERFHALIKELAPNAIIVDELPPIEDMKDNRIYFEETSDEPPELFIPDASLYRKGITLLSNDISEREDRAATPKALKSVDDKVVELQKKENYIVTDKIPEFEDMLKGTFYIEVENEQEDL